MNDRPLGAFSDEIAALRDHINARLDATEGKFDSRIAQAEGRVGARVAEQSAQIMALTVQVKETNGRVRAIELWKARADGALAATGLNWRVLAGVTTIVVAVSALAVSIAVAVMR